MFNQVPKDIVQTNRLPFLIGIIVLIAVMAVFMYKGQKNQKAGEAGGAKPRQSMDISPKSAGASWFNDDKFKNIKINYMASSRALTSKERESQAISAQEADLRKEEIEDEYAVRLEIKKLEDKNRIEEKKLEWQAMKSSLEISVPSVPGTSGIARGGTLDKNDPAGAINELLDLARSMTGGRLPALGALPAVGADTNNQDGKETFLKRPDAQDDYLETRKQRPRSPYELKAGSYIPAALITGIDSDLPGSVSAQVTENVYDTVTGNWLLIPQGARLVGEYNSNLTFGQSRVQVVWTRIIFPDGKAIDLEKMQGVDISGHTGFSDKVDNHYGRIYGNAVLLSLMGAGYDILNQKAEQDTDPRETVAAAVGQKMADVSGRSLEKNMDVQPTLIIAPGYKFRVMVTKDMVLEDIENAEGTLPDAK